MVQIKAFINLLVTYGCLLQLFGFNALRTLQMARSCGLVRGLIVMLGNLIIMPLRITPENMASCLKLCSIFFIMLNLVVQNNFF